MIQPQSELDIGSWYVTHPTHHPTQVSPCCCCSSWIIKAISLVSILNGKPSPSTEKTAPTDIWDIMEHCSEWMMERCVPKECMYLPIWTKLANKTGMKYFLRWFFSPVWTNWRKLLFEYKFKKIKFPWIFYLGSN